VLRTTAPSPATDIYGVGTVLYEMVTGRWPFEGELLNNPDRKLFENRYPQIRGHRPPRPGQFNVQLTPGLEAVVMKCIAYSPQQRFRSARELAKALASLLKGNDQLWPEPLELKQMMV
jgi:serine/threonine protein kinase